MKNEAPTRGLLASKPGFVFLVISVLLASLFTCSLFSYRIIHAWDYLVVLSSGAVVVNIIHEGGLSSLYWILSGGFDWSWDTAINFEYRYNQFITMVNLPLWMLLLPTSATSWLFYRRARRKRLIGHCPNCEYDLTGNISGVCPECGASVSDPE